MVLVNIRYSDIGFQDGSHTWLTKVGEDLVCVYGLSIFFLYRKRATLSIIQHKYSMFVLESIRVSIDEKGDEKWLKALL